MVESFLLEQEVAQTQAEMRGMAEEVRPLLENADGEGLYAFCRDTAKAAGGRVMVLDRDGIVQMDALAELNGVRVTYPEAEQVLAQGSAFSYGYYRLRNGDPSRPGWLSRSIRWLIGRSGQQQWVAYCVMPLSAADRIVGAVFFSFSIQDVVNRMDVISGQLTLLSVGICLIAFAVSLLVSGAILRPIKALTYSIRQMAQGNFSQRVQIWGRSEFSQMGDTFNVMAERLENMDKQRNQFVSNASHEMKTPLASVKILVETLQEMHPLDEDMTREFLGDINAEVDRMNRLITDLLTLVRREEIDPTKDFDEVDLAALTRGICKKLMPLAKSRAMALTLNQPQEAWVEGSGGALEQMMTNLIDNAIKYTPDGGSVRVDIIRVARTYIITVRDTGIGIAPEHIPYIFDRFYRIDKARSRATGGTGLGLAIVKDVVQQHSGTITVDSTLGEGTTMRVVLPALD